MKDPYLKSFKTRLKPFSGRPDLTPMVDVMFLLLIFFMLSSSFVQVTGLNVELPRVSTKGSMGIEKFIVTVEKNEKGCKIYFNDKEMTWETLKQELAAVSSISNSGKVIIRADQRTPFGIVTQIMSLAEKANLSTFIVTMPPEEKKETVFEQNER
ncbi:MAG: biopolymer transporter ExbD [Victivallaceae bacterium]